MKEVLCARLPATLHCPDLRGTLAFYRDSWGFALRQHVPGVFAVLARESVTVQLWQHGADIASQPIACRLLVDSVDDWRLAVWSPPGQPAGVYTEPSWGAEWGVSDCDGNRLLLVQSAAHAARRGVRA
jgi:hypothetical protein